MASHEWKDYGTKFRFASNISYIGLRVSDCAISIVKINHSAVCQTETETRNAPKLFNDHANIKRATRQTDQTVDVLFMHIGVAK